MNPEKQQWVVKKNSRELNRELAQWLVMYIEETIARKNFFSWALSGGNTPQQLYQLLATEKFSTRIDWQKIHFFWGDERQVPFSDPGNNARMAFENLLSHVPVKKEQVHIIHTEKEAPVAAAEYESMLHGFFQEQGTTFDLVLLGLGDNAHTLSLFPGNDIVFEQKHWVRSFYLEEQKMERITLTAPVVNAAAQVVFLITGAGKATALWQVLEGNYNPSLYPAQIIRPVNGNLSWWVDEAAAKKLTNNRESRSTI